MATPLPPDEARSHRGTVALLALCAVTLAALAAPSGRGERALAQSCPPYCETPVITPAWHLHMCDETYEAQLDDNHCMIGPGVTDFPSGTDRVYVIYCHRRDDTVRIVVKDSGGGEQFVNHPDGITYSGDRCETLEYRERTGIPPGGSPYYTSASWPEGPFSGIGAGIEWFVGLYVIFDADIYYGLGAEAVITARDPAANLDAFVKERITVRVTSDLDPDGIAVVLEEPNSGAPIFRSIRPLRFSTEASNEAGGVIRVADRSTITVSYCPRECRTTYSDTAEWLAGAATVTPTPLPTYSGPRPTITPTAPPEVRLETLTLRPATEDVGYVPQISNNKSRVNHLGYPTIYSGMWTRGDNVHYGMIQFDLASVPRDARVVSARVELIGQTRQFYDGGDARLELLDGGIDALWRDATFQDVHGAPVLAQIGPTVAGGDLAEERLNLFGFAEEQLAHVASRLATTRRLSFRVAGPGGEENSLFAWHSGVDLYGRATEPPDPADRPALVLGFAFGPSPTPTPPGGASTATPSPPVAPATASPTAPVAPASASPTAPSGATASPTVAPSPSPSPSAIAGATATEASTPVPGATLTPSPSPSPTPADASPTPDGGAGTAAPTPGDTPGAPTPAGPRQGRQACVLAYEDRDADGLRDPDERFLAGVTVRLTHVATGAFITWTTDGANDPDFCWNGLSDGRYVLRLDDLPAGMAPSGAASHTFDVPLAEPSTTFAFGAHRPAESTAAPPPTASPTRGPTPAPTSSATPSATPTPTASPTVVGPAGDVCVVVFLDRDGNGFADPGEAPVDGAEILVETESRAPARRLLSRVEPVCARLGAGVYFVAVTPAEGFASTTAAESAVLVTAGSRQALQFGWRPISRRAGPIFVPFAYRPSQRH